MLIINSLIISTALLASDITIEQVLPDTAIACVTVKNVNQLSSMMEQSGICSAICTFLCSGENGEDSEQCFISCLNSDEFANSLGLDDWKSITLPDGNAGFGVYPTIDFETSSVGIGMLAILDISNSKWGSIIKSLTDDMSQQLEIEIVDLSGRSVMMITQKGEIVTQAVDAISEYGFEINGLDRLYLHVSDDYLAACTEPDGLATFFNAVDGDVIDDSLSDSDSYKALMSRLDGDSDIEAALMLENLSDTVMQMDETGMMMMMLPMTKSLIGDIDGLAETVKVVPNEDTLFEVEYTVWMGDGRNGLLGVIGDEPIDASIPGYVGPDTLSFSQFRIDLDKLVPLFKTIIQDNPMLASQFGTELEFMIASLEMAVEPLGDELIFVSTGNLPVSENSLGYLTAIECTDEQACNNYLSSVLPSIGAVPTDFLGYQMFTADLGPMMPLPVELSYSIATAGGYLFIGSSNSVENALRTIANPKESYTDHASNSAAFELQQGDITGWGYADPARSMEIQTLVSFEMTNDMFAEMEAFDPEMAAEFRKDFEEEQETSRQYFELFSKLFGKAAWNFTTDEFGINSRGTLLNSN